MCGLSEGEEPALQGLTTSLIDRIYHARLFTSVAVVEIVAKLVGGPMMGKLFSIGKNGGGQGSKGICFSVSAASFPSLLYGLSITNVPLGSAVHSCADSCLSETTEALSMANRVLSIRPQLEAPIIVDDL